MNFMFLRAGGLFHYPVSGVGRFQHDIERAALSQHTKENRFASPDLRDCAAEFSDRPDIDTIYFFDEIAFVKAL